MPVQSSVPMTLRDSFFQDDFFKNAWEDFEKVRQEMLKSSQEFWSRVDRDMKAMDADMVDFSNNSKNMLTNSNMNNSSSMSKTSSSSSSSTSKSSSSQMQNSGSNNSGDFALAPMGGFPEGFAPWVFPRKWMLPKMFGEDSESFANLDIFKNKDDSQVIRVRDDDSKFELSLDTHEFRPDEIKVNVSGNMLSVEGKHEEKGDNKFVSRQFSRKYTLPEGCEAHKVSSNLSSDGILMITAPKRQAIKTDASKSVPIAVTHTK